MNKKTVMNCAFFVYPQKYSLPITNGSIDIKKFMRVPNPQITITTANKETIGSKI